MNLYEAQDFFKQMHPGKEIKFEFDEKCHRVHEIIYTDGVPNPVHHIDNNKVKVTVDGMPPVYIPIDSHRECCSWDEMKNMINSRPNPKAA